MTKAIVIRLLLGMGFLALLPLKAETNLLSPPAAPTEVDVAVFVIDLIEVDGSSQTFTADLVVRIRWMDPRLAEPGTKIRRVPMEDVWHPKGIVANLRKVDRRLPEVIEIEEDGQMTYRQRTIGTFAQSLDLRSFPHDTQHLSIQVIAPGHSDGDLVFKVDDEASGRSDHFTITDWEVGEVELEVKPYTVPSSGREVPGFALSFEVTRLTRYYFGTIFATVGIIASMAWLVYWLPINAINPRISISVTSMLALIAYRFVASQDLPRLPYLTRMDHFLFGAALLILAGLATVVAVAHEEARGRVERATRLNRGFRWLYPAILGALLLFYAI